MAESPTPQKSYGQNADEFLRTFYASLGALTTRQRIAALDPQLGGPPPNYYAIGGHLDDEMKLTCLEYEFLEQKGLLPLDPG